MGIETQSPKPESPRDQMEKMKDGLAVQKAKDILKDELAKKGKGNLETDGKVQDKDDPSFQQSIDFIKGHPEDHPLNAQIDVSKVVRVVVLTGTQGEGKGQSIAIALDVQNNLLGMAD